VRALHSLDSSFDSVSLSVRRSLDLAKKTRDRLWRERASRSDDRVITVARIVANLLDTG